MPMIEWRTFGDDGSTTTTMLTIQSAIDRLYDMEYVHREKVGVELAEQRNMINALRTSIQQLREDNVRLLNLIEKIVDMDKPRAEAVHALAMDNISIRERLTKLEGGSS